MALVGAQMALCVVLVFGALLLALRNLERVDGRLATDSIVGFAIDATIRRSLSSAWRPCAAMRSFDCSSSPASSLPRVRR
jgi:hypothetical protein